MFHKGHFTHSKNYYELKLLFGFQIKIFMSILFNICFYFVWVLFFKINFGLFLETPSEAQCTEEKQVPSTPQEPPQTASTSSLPASAKTGSEQKPVEAVKSEVTSVVSLDMGMDCLTTNFCFLAYWEISPIIKEKESSLDMYL